VAQLAEKVDVDVWEAKNGDARLRAALDYLVPYTDPKKPWPYPTIKEANRMEMFQILKIADRVFPNGNYLEMVETLPLKQRKIQRTNLVFPLMR